MNQNKHVEGSDSVDLLAELRYYFFFWSWYIGIMLFSIACTLLYFRYCDVVYETTATIQVKEAQSDPSDFITAGTAAMFDFSNVKIDNYIARTTSNNNMRKVVNSLDLSTQVSKKGRVKNTLLFNDEIPCY